MSAPVPVHLICGFLGAGKTTLLRRILAEQPAQERLVVLVNEFGELGIDGQLLSGFDSEVMELASGCICCTLKADFVTSLSRLLHDFKPHRVIVEATGLAEAGDLSRAVDEVAAREDVTLGSVATVVDADFFTFRDMLGPLYFNQIKHADLLLLNKVDLVAPEEVAGLTAALAEINPQARIMPVVHCAVDRTLILWPGNKKTAGEDLIGPAGRRTQDTLPDLTKAPGPEHASTEGFTAFSFEHPGVFDPDCFNRFLADLPWEVFRLKGFIRLPEGKFLINYTFRRPELTPAVDDGQGISLALVAWRLDPDNIISGLKGCLTV